MPSKLPAVSFEFEPDKAVAALSYLAQHSELVPEFDKYKAAKLMFLADKYHLVRFGRPIAGGTYRALEHGPIPTESLNLINALMGGWDIPAAQLHEVQQHLELVNLELAYPRIKARGTAPIDALSQSDIEALDHAMARYGRLSFPELKNLTHMMPAYLHAWNSRRDGARSAPMRYEDFFEEDGEAIAGTLEEMLETHEIKAALDDC